MIPASGGNMQVRKTAVRLFSVFALIISATILQTQTTKTSQPKAKSASNQVIQQNAQQMLDEGQRAFRFDTFGDEGFWGDTLKLHQAIAGAKNGGVGPGISPKTALSVGLKVDADAIPSAACGQDQGGQGRPGRSRYYTRVAQAQCGGWRHRIF
jgi:hypothetical protein